MSDKRIGAIEWRDLTVGNAEQLKDFYSAIVGWKTEPLSMGDYNDFNVNLPDSGKTIACICHNRGDNAKQAAQWMMYVRVADAKVSATKTGELIDGPREMAGESYYVIRDSAGAVLALFS